jgi:hypothetical protein
MGLVILTFYKSWKYSIVIGYPVFGTILALRLLLGFYLFKEENKRRVRFGSCNLENKKVLGGAGPLAT